MRQEERTARSLRNPGLELLRGLAAMVVAASHGFIAFRPELFGLFEGFPRQLALTGNALFVAINGMGAVVLFFTLSGFVLSHGAFSSKSWRPLRSNLIKRYPRLAGPILFAVVLSWLLFSLGLYFHEQAGRFTGSPWLEQFGLSPLKAADVSLPDALFQGLIGALLLFQSSYDTPLWTMGYEFYGSLEVLALAALLLSVPRQRLLLQSAVLAAAGVISWMINPWFSPFVAGLAFSLLVSRRPMPEMFRLSRLGGVVVLAGLYLLGHSAPDGVYSWLAGVDTRLTQLAGSLMVMAVAVANPVRSSFVQLVARSLGRLSFPLYLVHVIVICSFSSYLLVASHAHDGPALRNMLALVSVAASMLVAYPLAVMNEAWLQLVNRWTDSPIKLLEGSRERTSRSG